MKKKYFTIIPILAISIGMLAGCGDGTGEAEGVSDASSASAIVPVTVSAPPVYATPEPVDPSEIRLLYLSGELTEEEEKAIRESMQILYQNLDIPEYIGEAIHMVESENWFETMTAGTNRGGGSYSLYQGENPILTVNIGEDSSGLLYADVLFESVEGKLIELKQFGGITQLLLTTSQNGLPNGAFESWRIDSTIGEIVWEKGTYVDGRVVGEMTTSKYVGVEGDAFDLWTNREGFTYEVSTTTYDQEGNPITTPTPDPTAPPSSTTTPKPNVTPKPNITPKPPAPTPNVPVQEPDDGNNDDDDDDDDDDNNDDNNGGGVPEPPQQPEPPQGGDVDVGWSPDLD